MRATAFFLLSSLACLQSLAAESDPLLLAPGAISSAANEASPAFTPDGRTVYFTRNNGNDYDILVSQHHGASWSTPVLAPFSGQWRDLEATMAPDGSYLIFASSRPLPGSSASPDGFWGGVTHPGKGGNLWRVDRTSHGGWGQPVRLPDVVNRNASTFSPAIAADGTLYFMEVYGDSKRFHLFRSEMHDGVYQPPEPMPFTRADWSDVDPAVAPDQSFLIFSSTRPPAPPQTQQLFIVFRRNSTWGEARALPERINRLRPITEARLGPDAHTLYFSSSFVQPVRFPKDLAATREGLRDMQRSNNGNDHIWQVDISDVLQSESSPVTAAQIAPLSATPVRLGGIIDQDNDDTLAFTPDGNIVFFDRSDGPRKTIMVSHRIDGQWSPPQPASFSGRWFDQDPLVAPDGSFLLFNSDRPISSGGQPLVQNYFSGGPGPGSNIWRVDRTADHWGDPVWLGPTINSDVFIDFASLAADGTLYFMRWDAAQKSMHLWRSQYKHGAYLTPEFVALGDPAASIHDPAVAPDQSFIVFDYGKVKGGLGRLCIAFREGDQWGQPIDLGDGLNKDLPWGSHLDPDGRTIYFTGKSGIQRLSLVPWLDARRP